MQHLALEQQHEDVRGGLAGRAELLPRAVRERNGVQILERLEGSAKVAAGIDAPLVAAENSPYANWTRARS